MDELPESLKDEIDALDSLRDFAGDKHHVRRHLGEEAHDRLPRRTAVRASLPLPRTPPRR